MVDRSLLEREMGILDNLQKLYEERKRAQEAGENSRMLEVDEAIARANVELSTVRFEQSQNKGPEPQTPNPEPTRNPEPVPDPRRSSNSRHHDDDLDETRERLRRAAGRERIIGHIKEKTPGTALALFLAFLVLAFEFSESASLLQARLGVYFGLVFLLFLFGGRNMEMAKRSIIAALVVNVLMWIYRTGLTTDLIGDALSSDAVLTVFMLFVLPGFVWYLLLLEPDLDVSNKLRWLGTFFIFIIVFSLTMTHVTFVGGSLPGGFDTREAAGNALQNIAIGFGGGLENFVCWIGFDASCGFAGWLNEQLSPFSYDATTVHQIQNERLGAYIRDVRTERTFDITGMGPGQFLPDSVEFTIHAPIPPEIERDLCSTLMTIPAFGDLCSEQSVRITCEVDDVSATRVEPRDQYTLREVIAQSNTISRCRVQVPSDVAFSQTRSTSTSKQVRVAAEYPFLTTTFKLIRAIDRNADMTPEVRRAYDSFSEDSIISAGGPVIITTDQNERMAVEKDSTHPITFRLSPQMETRLTGVHLVALYIPAGLELLDSGPGSNCRFTSVALDAPSEDIEQIQDEICAQFSETDASQGLYERCVEACDSGIDPGGCQGIRQCCIDACGEPSLYYEHETRESLGCRDLSSTIIAHFTPQTENTQVRPGSIYFMRPETIETINNALTADPSLTLSEKLAFWNRQRQRDTLIQCTLKVNSTTTLLDEGLDVTERTILAIAAYTVEHAQTAQIRFEGLPRITSFPSTPLSTAYIPKGLSEPVPVGVVPYESGKVTITDVFRSKRSGGRLHTGLDLVGESSKRIVSSWDGVVKEVCRDGNRCPGGYGNFVLIESKQGSMNWDHLYSHFEGISPSIINGAPIRQGQYLGIEGTTGESTGNHLHFEIRIRGFGLVDPFILIYDPDRFNERNLERAMNNWQQSWERAIDGPPLVHTAYFSETHYDHGSINSQVSSRTRVSGAGISCTPTPEEIRTILEAARTYSVPPPVMFAVAAQESNCKHRDDTTTSKLTESAEDAIGMFQIVTSSTKCNDAMEEFGVDASRYGSQHANFEFHAYCAANILYDKYLDNLRRHKNNPGQSCGQFCFCEKVEPYDQTGYEGWKAAVKGYHGWGCFDTELEGKEYETNVGAMVEALDSLITTSNQATETWKTYG